MSVADVSHEDRRLHTDARLLNAPLWLAVSLCLVAGGFVFVEHRTGVLSGTVAKVKVVECGASQPNQFVVRTEVVFLRSNLRSGLALIPDNKLDDRWPMSTYDRTAVPNFRWSDFFTCLRSGQGCDTWTTEEVFQQPISIQLSNCLWSIKSVAKPAAEYRLRSGGSLTLLEMSPDPADGEPGADEQGRWTARFWVD